jgi:hypothetical protein
MVSLMLTVKVYALSAARLIVPDYEADEIENSADEM